MRYFKPTRIGHGVRSIEDKELIQHLKEARIHLEMCPTSNVQITPMESYNDHLIDRLYSSGVSVGINTDARTISNVTLAHEYEVLQRVFGWKAEHFRVCNVNAIEAAFIPTSIRLQLTDTLQTAYRKSLTEILTVLTKTTMQTHALDDILMVAIIEVKNLT